MADCKNKLRSGEDFKQKINKMVDCKDKLRSGEDLEQSGKILLRLDQLEIVGESVLPRLVLFC